MTEMAEMVVAGVFTVKVGRVIEEVCERSFSKQSVF
jgi:transposase-like protein